EVGAKYLNKIFIENIRTNNDFSIKRYARCPKRTAICVSGMMKIDDSAMRSLYQKIAEPLNADIFLHTWDKIQVWSGEARKSGFWQRQFKLPDNKIPHPLRDIDKFKEKFPRTGNLLLSTITDDINVHFSATHPLIKMSVIENEDVALHNWLNNKSFMSRGNYNQFKMYY
ncbi:TPA: acyltransferase, partial [Escherichia coli]